MKRVGLLLALLLLVVAACAPGGATDTFQQESEEPTIGAAAPADNADETSDEPAAEPTEAAESTAPEGDPSMARDADWKLGNSVDPAVTIIEYGDYQCPGCGGVAPLFKQLVETYPDDIQFIFRHFPLNSIHPNAQKSAEAAEAAGAQGNYWEYHDLLFARQREWSGLDETAARDFFVALAEELALDTDRFAAELDDGTYAGKVAASEQEAMELQLPGTPATFVNGQFIPGDSLPYEFEAWEAFVTEERNLRDLAARQYPAAPEMSIDVDGRYLARVAMENGGEFTIELLPASAPQTVNSFVFLARNGWFDNVTFHRVIPGFVAQTGDPSGTGRGGPGYYIPNEIDSSLSHDDKGVVAMANAGPNTNGSQWYITYGDVSQLDGSYTIFGKVIEGMDVVEGITPRDPSRTPNAPAGDMIKSITIEETLP